MLEKAVMKTERDMPVRRSGSNPVRLKNGKPRADVVLKRRTKNQLEGVLPKAVSSPDSDSCHRMCSSGGTTCTTTSSHLTSASSENERQMVRKIIASSKLKSKAKQEKTGRTRTKKRSSKSLTPAGNVSDQVIQETTTEKLVESLNVSFNKTLRWDNVCSDSEDEIERIKLYKENRRMRYAEALQVKIVKKMSSK